MRKLLAFLILFSFNALGDQKVLHPDFPVVEGKYQMTPEWYVTLSQPHNRRVDDGSLVLWRPGLTTWVNVWGNDNNESVDERLEWISSESSPKAFKENTVARGDVVTYSYRLNESRNGTLTYSYNAYVLANDSHVQISVYFDSESELKEAKSVIESVEHVQP